MTDHDVTDKVTYSWADLEIFRGSFCSGSLELQLQPSCKLKKKKKVVTCSQVHYVLLFKFYGD